VKIEKKVDENHVETAGKLDAAKKSADVAANEAAAVKEITKTKLDSIEKKTDDAKQAAMKAADK
jgi:hypothetical protein